MKVSYRIIIVYIGVSNKLTFPCSPLGSNSDPTEDPGELSSS